MNVNTNFGNVYDGNDSTSVFSGIKLNSISKEEFLERMESQKSNDDAAVSEISKEGMLKFIDEIQKGGKLNIEMTEEQKEEKAVRDKAFQAMVQPANANKIVTRKELEASASHILDDYNIMLSATAADYRAERDPKNGYSITDRAEDITKAYASLYDEIVKGYEEGTRESYKIDENAKGGYRLMTMEEELAELDKAFEKKTEMIASMVKDSNDIANALNKYEEQLAKYKRNGNAAEINQVKKDYTKGLENMPKDLSDKMKTVSDLFKQDFAQNKKLSMDFVNSLMKNNFYIQKNS